MHTNQQEEGGMSCLTHPPEWLTPPTTPTHDTKQWSPTMDQQGEEKVIKPIEEDDEETEEEYQRMIEEVREGRQHARAKEDIRDDILQRNISFNQHYTLCTRAPHEQHPGDEHNA